MDVQNTTIAETIGKLYRLAERWDGDGIPTREAEPA